MPEVTTHVELDLDDRLFAALAWEAERLGVPQCEVVRRAVAAWVGEMVDDGALRLMYGEAAEV